MGSSAGVEIARGPSITIAAVLGFLLAVGCKPADPVAGEPDDTDTGDAPVVDAEAFLSLETLPELHITLDATAWAALEAAPKEWVAGRFEYAGEVYEPVGVRLKGNHSFRAIDDKPSFKLKFNAYVPGRRFLGLEGLTLDNMVVDGSMLREWVSYRVFRALDVPAPRAGYAQVWVNDEYYGLYLSLEPYDDEFLARVYVDPSGNLYESGTNADLDGPVDAWDQDEGSDESLADLEAFSELAQREGNAVFYGGEAVVDVPRFLAFMAGETLMGHFDGHMGGHNFFIYHEPTADRWSYLPWSLDQAMARHVTPFEHEGYLADKCLHDARCQVDYVLASQQALEIYAAVDLPAEIAQAIALTDAAMRADEHKPYSEASVEAGREQVLGYSGGRVAELAPQLDCLVDGVQPDADGDGFGPCFQDCDESDPGINPAAVESCDGIDEDCSGFADDVPECECPSITSGGRTFYLCHNEITWLEARDFCAAQGRVLARFETAEQTADVWAAAAEIDPGRWAIGLNDRGEETDYRWLDDSTPGFDAWASGEPAHQLDWFDCVFLRNGAWYECNCIEKGSLVCTDD